MLIGLNPFYAMATLYLTLGALATVEMVLSNFGVVNPIPGLLWIRVHTIVLGGITQVIFGTLPRFLAARAGVPEPGRATQWRLWAVLNTAIVLVMLGMVGNQMHVVGAGIAVALVVDLHLLKIVWETGSRAEGETRLMARFYAAALWWFPGWP